MSLNLTTIKDLNSLDSKGVILVALEIFLPSGEVIRVVANNENITFKGYEFIAFPFNISEITTAKGEIPKFTLNIDNTSRAMQRYILEYDEYVKRSGSQNVAIEAKAYVLNTLDLNSAILEEFFELSDFSSNSKFVTFNLGTQSLFNLSYPPRKMYKDFCSFKFKDECCGYKGSDTTCDKSLNDCRQKNNSVRFGGFLGISGGYKK